MSYYELFQLSTYGNIIREDVKPELEHGSDEAERFNEWMRNGEESLLREMEAEFPYK
jgi:hypothetical protein